MGTQLNLTVGQDERLYEKYRPDSFETVVGQDKVLAKLQNVGDLGGRAFWISGKSGTGKTTLAWLMARQVAEDHSITELDGTKLTTGRLSRIEERMWMRGMGDKPGRVYIINEAHGMRRDTVRQMLTLLERVPSHVVFIFTTTRSYDPSEQAELFDGASDEADTMLSRCITLPLAQRGLAKPFARRAKEIAQQEGKDGASQAQYVRLVRKHRNNMRRVLEDIEAGEMLD